MHLWVESPQRVLKINTLYQPGLSVCYTVWFALILTRTSLSTNQKLKTWARKMTNKKCRKYNGTVGGPDVQTKKEESSWLSDWKYQPGLTFGPLFTCTHARNFNLSCWVNLSPDKGTYPARGADPAWLLFSCKYISTFDCKWVTCHSDSTLGPVKRASVSNVFENNGGLDWFLRFSLSDTPPPSLNCIIIQNFLFVSLLSSVNRF